MLVRTIVRIPGFSRGFAPQRAVKTVTIERVWHLLAEADGLPAPAAGASAEQLVVPGEPVDGRTILRLLVSIVAEDKCAPHGLTRWVRLRAHVETHGENLSDALRDWGLSRSTFLPRTSAIALRIAATLNAAGAGAAPAASSGPPHRRSA
jgi:hypothetical protein